jgi:hypothetical protein
VSHDGLDIIPTNDAMNTCLLQSVSLFTFDPEGAVTIFPFLMLYTREIPVAKGSVRMPEGSSFLTSERVYVNRFRHVSIAAGERKGIVCR